MGQKKTAEVGVGVSWESEETIRKPSSSLSPCITLPLQVCTVNSLYNDQSTWLSPWAISWNIDLSDSGFSALIF